MANNTNDFHEVTVSRFRGELTLISLFTQFQITSNNTALITVYSVEEYDLTSYNVTATDGSKGWIIQGYFQEIDPATGMPNPILAG